MGDAASAVHWVAASMCYVNNGEAGSLVLYGPNDGPGGTVNLMLNLATHWRESQVPLVVIDYAGGYLSSRLRERDVAFEHRLYGRGGVVHVRDGETLLAPILPARDLGYRILAEPDVRLLLWVTHPQDGFKWLPAYQVARTWSDEAKNTYARCTHPGYYQRLRGAYAQGVAAGGLLAMDEATASSLATQFALPGRPSIVPIFTDDAPAPTGRPECSPPGPLRVTWLGRLTDFKTQAVIALIREVALLRSHGEDVVLNIIGEGAERSKVEAAAASAGSGVVRFHGQLMMRAVDSFLQDNTDVLCGHGTAILEGAKLGVPSLVIDGTYKEAPESRRVGVWLCDAPAPYVGLAAAASVDRGGSRLSELLMQRSHFADVGRRCRERWEQHHGPAAAAAHFAQLLESSSWLMQDLEAAGFRRFGTLDRPVMALRRRLTVGKY